MTQPRVLAGRNRRCSLRTLLDRVPLWIEQIDQGERQVGAVFRQDRAADGARLGDVFASRVRAASACVVFSRRSPSTRSVVSVTVTSTPPTCPPSSRIGLYEKMK